MKTSVSNNQRSSIDNLGGLRDREGSHRKTAKQKKRLSGGARLLDRPIRIEGLTCFGKRSRGNLAISAAANTLAYFHAANTIIVTKSFPAKIFPSRPIAEGS
jgi:hypothetical protein